MNTVHGKLAYKFCGVSKEVEVLRSRAGFYIGTSNENSYPLSRESVEYWETFKQAEKAKNSGLWTQRNEP